MKICPAAFAVLLSLSPALAQEPTTSLPSTGLAAPETASFLIERVDVEGLKSETARDIVRAESLLTAGRSYSERELREAVFRVRRLPFVIDADMSIGRGSERGAYVLTVSVEAAKPVAYAVDVVGSGQDRRSFGEDRFNFAGAGTLGVRKFLGSRGVLFGSVQGFDDQDAGQVLQLGYTRYGLFRPGGFATVAASTAVGGLTDDQDLQSSVQAGVPLVGNHALRADATYTRAKLDTRSLPLGGESRFTSWSAQLEWIYDNTDDPLVPLEGRRVTTTLGRSNSVHRLRFGAADGEQRFEQSGWDLRAEGRQYRPLTTRQSIGVGLAAEYNKSDSNFLFAGESFRLVGVELIHAVSLFDSARSSRGDLRLESAVGAQWSEVTGLPAPFRGRRDTSALARVGLTYRHAWGLLRLSLIYVDQLGDSL